MKAHVRPEGAAVVRSDLLRLVHLERRHALAHVANRRSEADSALLQLLVYVREDLIHLVQVAARDRPARYTVFLHSFGAQFEHAGRIVPIAGIDFRVVNPGPGHFLADAGTIVQRPAGLVLRGVPLVDMDCSGLEVHARGHAIERGKLKRQPVERMEVQVDEARRHHVTRGVDGFGAGDLAGCDDRDPAVLDAHVELAVEHRLGVHDPAVQDYQVVVLRLGTRPSQ